MQGAGENARLSAHLWYLCEGANPREIFCAIAFCDAGIVATLVSGFGFSTDGMRCALWPGVRGAMRRERPASNSERMSRGAGGPHVAPWGEAIRQLPELVIELTADRRRSLVA